MLDCFAPVRGWRTSCDFRYAPVSARGIQQSAVAGQNDLQHHSPHGGVFGAPPRFTPEPDVGGYGQRLEIRMVKR
jgi:hypothetical protein